MFKKKHYLNCISITIGLFFLLCIYISAALAGDYPTKEIELIVPYSPGGGTDLMSRIVASKASEYLKVPVIIVNKPGAGGIIGTEYVSKSHDGYRVCPAGASNLGTVLATNPKISYSLKDFTALNRCRKLPLVLVVKKDRYVSFDDIIKEAEKRPITFGSWGTYSSAHLIGELIAMVTGIKMNHVPFKGGANAIVAAMGGHIDIAISTPMGCLPNINAGKLTAIAITTDYRIDSMPNVPTLKELGFQDATFESYEGFATSSKVPIERLNVLRSAFDKSVQDIGIQKALKKGGFMYGYMPGPEYDAYLQTNLEKLKKIAIHCGYIVE